MWRQLNVRVFVGMLGVVLFKPAVLQKSRDLNLAGFLPMSGHIWPAGRVLIPAVEMAIRDINNRTNILADYKLNFIWWDTKCDAGSSTNALYDMLYSSQVSHMIIGPGCSTGCEVQAQASHAWNISHFSYGCASPMLSNKERFPRFFRINPPDTHYNLARLALIRQFNWKKVATINVALDFFSAITHDFVARVQGTDIEIISEEIYDHDPSLRVKNLKDKDARIILAAAYENSGRLILCAAYKNGLYGPKIVWMFPGWYVPYWWRVDLANVPCTQDEMDVAAEGHLLTGVSYKNSKDERGIADMTITEFETLFLQEPTYTPYTKKYEYITANMYDSIWGSALALNCTDAYMKDNGYNKTLDEFEYSDTNLGDIIAGCLYNVSYLGLSGYVKFDKVGEPLKNIQIFQVREMEKLTVATYVIEKEPLHFEWQNGGIIWRGGVAPRDSTQIKYIETRIPDPLYIVMSCLATSGIVLSLVLFAFNVFYRNHVYIKLSSPNINNVLLFGCMLSYTTVFMFTSKSTEGEKINIVFCKMRHVIFTIGFTMAFGAMFSKTWRVYRIFCNKKLLRLKIKDSQLISIVIGILSVMTIILVTWEIIDPLHVHTLHLKNQVYWTGNDVEVLPYIRDCTSNYYSHFLWTICIVEGLLLSFGTFLSFETRKVTIEALNDSKHIGLCLYNAVILSVLGLILSLLLDNQTVLVYGIVSGFITLGTTTTLLIVFIPKIQSVFYPHTVDIETPHPSFPGVRLGSRLNEFEPRTASCSKISTSQTAVP